MANRRMRAHSDENSGSRVSTFKEAVRHTRPLRRAAHFPSALKSLRERFHRHQAADEAVAIIEEKAEPAPADPRIEGIANRPTIGAYRMGLVSPTEPVQREDRGAALKRVNDARAYFMERYPPLWAWQRSYDRNRFEMRRTGEQNISNAEAAAARQAYEQERSAVQSAFDAMKSEDPVKDRRSKLNLNRLEMAYRLGGVEGVQLELQVIMNMAQV